MRRSEPIIVRTLLFAVLVLSAHLAVAAGGKSSWVASWGASPFVFQSFNNAPPPAPIKNQTIRQVVRLSVGGNQLQVRFSNEVGSVPVTINAASIAIVDKDSAVESNTVRKLSFGGSDSITIPPGAPALSDAVDLKVDTLAQVAVSIYIKDETPTSTVHMGRIAYISEPGNFTQAATLADAKRSSNLLFLSGIYVNRAKATNVVVALGDSITDGAASTPFSFNSWPDQLAQRLHDNKIDNVSVINQGISGNQVLRDGAGISALARFDRDVLSTPGLTHIILLEGINDIGSGGMVFPGTQGPPPANRTPEEIIAGYQQLILRAHSQLPSVKIYGATLTPFEGTYEGYYSPEKDVTRHKVNDWIRNSGAFDAVIHFDKAIQDANNPNKIKAEYDSGDKLHPNDVGYKKMADSIDLKLLRK